MGIFVSLPKLIESLVCALAFTALYCACCYKPLGILQSCGYSTKKLTGWVKKKNNLIFSRQCLLAFLCVLSVAVLALCFSFAGGYAALIGFASYPVFFIWYIAADRKRALRSPAAFTPRFIRLYSVLGVFTFVLVFMSVTLLNYADYKIADDVFGYLRYCPLAVFPLLIFPVIIASNAVACAYEIPHNKKFVKKAKAKLSASDIKVIGITGSYGKTSVKHILAGILSQKYRVLHTPRSHNTPLGLALTINNNNLADYDILIAEMGARHAGDIAELCGICPPDIAVITGICPQHLESFGSEENIIKAKGEILQNLKGEAVIADDCFESFSGYSCNKLRPDCVSDIKCGSSGSDFKLTLGGKSVKAHTALLGRHAVDNIALAATVAHCAGMDVQQIAEAVSGIDYVEHRLQLIKSGGVNILDDGYNSNVKGAAAALEVLRSFDGRKIAVTPGLVELGVLEESENKMLGAKLAGLDYVILVGDTLVTPVKEGYLQSGGEMEKLVLKPSLAAAQEELKKIIRPGDTVLFLNDLPDIY